MVHGRRLSKTNKKVMYKNMEDVPFTFGPTQLAEILDISRKKSFELVHRADFSKYHMRKKIIVSKKNFMEWMGIHFGESGTLI